MKVAVLFKLLEVGAAGICAWTLTSAILGRHGGPVRAADAAPVPATVKTLPVGALPQLRGTRPGATDDAAVFQMREYKARVVGRNVLVQAAANISDKRQGIRYLWDLDIMDPHEKTSVQRRLYEDQMFFPTGEQETIQPTFKEVLTLSPGTYRVVLRLYAIPGGLDPEVLRDKKQMNGWQVLGGNEAITIAL